ncbi:hypothetical protein V8F06_002353 [Rhypophila decipiens]
MGNLCGKESDHFATPGRRLDATPAQPKTASVPTGASRPSQPPPKVGGPPRTLGGSGGGGGGAGSSSSAADDARRKAAEAAEQRAKQASTTSGKLSSQLAAQKKQTRTDTLKELSETQLRQRDMDVNADVRNHN